jgi:hypothetical protein
MPPNIVKIGTSRRLWWAEFVVWMGEIRNACRILVGNCLGESCLLFE